MNLPSWLSGGALGCVVAAVLAPLPASAAGVPTPSANIPLPPLPPACGSAPTGAICEHAAVAALDAARAKLGLGRYKLPSGFLALRPARQMLVLTNLDRIAYGVRPITGLTAPLNLIARQGAVARADPNPWTALMALPGQMTIGFASNWAGGQPNALVAYYGWLYDDGYGSGNIDCPSPSASGCWGHRRDIFAFPAAPSLSMGASAIATGGPSYAMTVVETTTPPWPYSWKWPRSSSSRSAFTPSQTSLKRVVNGERPRRTTSGAR